METLSQKPYLISAGDLTVGRTYVTESINYTCEITIEKITITKSGRIKGAGFCKWIKNIDGSAEILPWSFTPIAAHTKKFQYRK